MSFCPHCEQKIIPPDSYDNFGAWVMTLDPTHPIRAFVNDLPKDMLAEILEGPAPDYNKIHILKLYAAANKGKPKAQSQLRMMVHDAGFFS